MLTKTQAVMRRIGTKRGRVHFDDFAGPPDIVVTLNEDRWRDMGEPDEITVSIEPGRRL